VEAQRITDKLASVAATYDAGTDIPEDLANDRDKNNTP
jgi:hypothetical protein